MNWLRTAGLRLLLAVGLGFTLWVYVTTVVSPDQSQIYQTTVTPQGLRSDTVIVDENGLPTELGRVTVIVEANQEAIAEIQSTDLQTSVDLSDLGPGVHTVPIDVTLEQRGLRRVNLSTDPTTLSVRLESLVEKTVPIRVDQIGSVPSSYEADEAEVTIPGQSEAATTAVVSGPQSRVDTVDSAAATIDLTDRSATYTSPRELVPLTESGQVVEGVTISPEIVNVRVPIRSIVGIKRVPIEPQLVGAPASGYIVRDISVEPQLVSLTGSSGPLDQVLSVTTEEVDISGASETITRTVAINQPAGAAFQEAQSPTATVVVRFAPIERQFSVTLPVRVQGTNPPRNVQVSISPQVVDVTFSGTSAEFDALDAQTLVGSINLRNLNPGTYQRAPSINVPDGLTIVGDVPAVTVTLQPPPTATPEPTAPPTAAPTSTGTPAPAEAPTEEPAAPTNTPAPNADDNATPTAAPPEQTPTS